MTVQTHIDELRRRHAALKKEIEEATAHPSVDDATLSELKRRKLLLKDEIANLDATQEVLH